MLFVPLDFMLVFVQIMVSSPLTTFSRRIIAAYELVKKLVIFVNISRKFSYQIFLLNMQKKYSAMFQL